MFDKLLEAEKRFNEVEKSLEDPETVAIQSLFTSLMKENKNLTPIIEKYR